MKFNLLVIPLLFLFTLTISAQTDSTEVTGDTTNSVPKDTTDVENWESWEDWDDVEFDVDMLGDEFRGAPTIYFSWGLGGMSHNDIGNRFSEPGSLELKLGKTYQKDYKEENDILKYRMNFLFLSNLSTDISSKNDKVNTDTWRFGLGRATGYGYKLNSAAIIPYNSNSFTWTRLDASEPARLAEGAPTPSQDSIISRYDEAFRFGNTTEAGIKFQIIPNLSLEPSYERTVVYERHLFWKWGGSMLIEIVAQGLLDEFIEEVMDRSPYAGPVVNFVLKNALAYGMYELRKDKMNWPFPSAPGLMYDQFKIGMTFVF